MIRYDASVFENHPLTYWKDLFDQEGYLLFENVLSNQALADIRAALDPYLNGGKTGRNDFEGLKTNRVYALPAKSSVFAELAIHPMALAFAEAELGQSCLLSACLAINLHPSESAQPWHHDDEHIAAPLPRPAYGVSAFWMIDETTDDNGATEIIPRSHLWTDQNRINGSASEDSFQDTKIRAADDDPGARDDAVKVTAPAGSLMIAKGTLWHRGGANRSTAPRLVITPQYCAGWARQLENMALTMTAEQAMGLPERARELIGYSIHPPFMGYVDGMHPARTLKA